ncbi:MAG: hypothetical protein C0410_12020 [Anaerolinea sp.]|nr:hypothetical protein [Anaerolinea sp.]
MIKTITRFILFALFILFTVGCGKSTSDTTANENYTVSDVQKISLAQKDAGFTLKLPNQLPKDYIFKDVTYVPEQQAITVVYGWNDPAYTGEMLFLTQQLQKPDDGYVTKDATVEDVLLGNLWAEFVQGTNENGKWINDAPMYRLRWEAHGYTFTLIFTGNETSSKGFITKDELIKLGEQLLW